MSTQGFHEFFIMNNYPKQILWTSESKCHVYKYRLAMEVNVNMNVFFSFWKGRDWDSRIIRMNYLQLLFLLSILLIQTNFMMQILGVAW